MGIAQHLDFTADSNGYMLTYKGQNLGGAGVLRRSRPLRGNQRRDNARMFAEDAKREIAALVAGGGQARFRQIIHQIDGEGTV